MGRPRLLAAVIAIELAIVGITVLLNQWNTRFYNALQERTGTPSSTELTDLLRAGGHLHRARGLPALSQSMAADPLAAVDDRSTISATGSTRPTITACSCWATPPTTPTSASPTTSSCSSIARSTIGIGLLSAIVTLASFVVILWGLSTAAPLHLFGAGLCDSRAIWSGRALIYAVLGTVLTHLIGWPLVALNFRQQRYEADFRFNLVRVRENSEQIALLQRRRRRDATPAGPLRPRGRRTGSRSCRRTKKLTASRPAIRRFR